MAILSDLHNPSFVMLAAVTNRTAWRPFGLPVILVVPHTFDTQGGRVNGSDVITDDGSLRIYIAGVDSGRTPVAGPEHHGMFNPDIEVYSKTITAAQLESRKITTTNNADGKLTITTRSGVTDTIDYLEHASYYDLSDIAAKVEQLPPAKYTLVYEVKYHPRKVSDTAKLVCLDETSVVYSRLRFAFNHPGDVLLQMVDCTPGVYLTDVKKSQDETIGFYRPFSEILQDIHDEQGFLERINWLYNIAPEYIPYLGYLLGWSLPYFPKSIDTLRRGMMRSMARLQRLKGTKRAVRELFDLFGFIVNISNVWYAPDGSKFVGVNDDPQYPITTVSTATYEPLLLDAEFDSEWRLKGYSGSGYGNVTVPLIHRPEGAVIVESFLVTSGSAADEDLRQIANNLSDDVAAYDIQYGEAAGKLGIIDPNGIVGYSKHSVSGYTSSVITESGYSLMSESMKFDSNSNVLKIGFNRYVQPDNTVIYVFATYKYAKLIIPDELSDLQSNRFDIEILSKDGEQVNADIIQFLIDFLFQIKAFHSLLRKIIYAVALIDVYQVTDYSVGGEISQDPTVDHGKQQVPPEAIIPNVPANRCLQLNPADMGYRPQDLKYRNIIIAGLADEFQMWSDLADDCYLNPRGQDRSKQQSTEQTGVRGAETIYSSQDQETLCQLDNDNYYYKGRVKDVLGLDNNIQLYETWRFKLCKLGLGNGTYFTAPATVFGMVGKTNGLLGRLLSEYGGTLYYDHGGLDPTNIDYRRLQALTRPSLNIEKDNLGFPGHRLPRIDLLYSDFTSSTYNLRPWDLDATCGCPSSRNDLGAALTTNSSGEQFLSFDALPFTVAGNSRRPDIPGLGDHSGCSEDEASNVTHKIYIAQFDGHPAITLDEAVSEIGNITTTAPVFQTATECGSAYSDISAGYPSETGWLSSDIPSTDYFPSITDPSQSTEVREALGIPAEASDSPQLLFKLSSQIRVDISTPEYNYYRGYRLDCGCLQSNCDSGVSVLDCTFNDFMSRYGNSDPDQVAIDIDLAPTEKFGAKGLTLDDPRINLLRLKQADSEVNENGYDTDGLPDTGNIIYKDQYSIIHEIYWDTTPLGNSGNYHLDIITITKDPRGMKSIIGGQTFSEGIITTTRQLFRYTGDTIILEAEGSEQSAGTFQLTYLCNAPFTDPFVHHLDNFVNDQVGMTATGPVWGDPVNPAGDAELWGDGTDPAPLLMWMNYSPPLATEMESFSSISSSSSTSSASSSSSSSSSRSSPSSLSSLSSLSSDSRSSVSSVSSNS